MPEYVAARPSANTCRSRSAEWQLHVLEPSGLVAAGQIVAPNDGVRSSSSIITARIGRAGGERVKGRVQVAQSEAPARQRRG